MEVATLAACFSNSSNDEANKTTLSVPAVGSLAIKPESTNFATIVFAFLPNSYRRDIQKIMLQILGLKQSQFDICMMGSVNNNFIGPHISTAINKVVLVMLRPKLHDYSLDPNYKLFLKQMLRSVDVTCLAKHKESLCFSVYFCQRSETQDGFYLTGEVHDFCFSWLKE